MLNLSSPDTQHNLFSTSAIAKGTITRSNKLGLIGYPCCVAHCKRKGALFGGFVEKTETNKCHERFFFYKADFCWETFVKLHLREFLTCVHFQQ